MGKQRKKTLQELMQERATGTGNQSAYTTEPRKTYNTSVKTQVDSLYKKNTTAPTNTWDKVVTRANQIYQDTTSMNSRYGVTQNQGNALLDKVKTTQTKPITEVKGGKKVDEAEAKYELNKIKKEKQQQERLKNIPEGNLPAKAVTVVGNAIQDIAQKPKAFYDGFDLMDIPKAIASTAGGAGAHVVGGVEQVGNAIAQGFGYGMATIDKALGKEEKAQAWIKATQQAEQEREDVRKKVFDIFDKNSVLGETSNQVAEGYGQSLAFGTVGQANKLAGDALVASQGFASGLQEAYSEEDVEAWQALMKGTGGAIISYLSENMFDNLGYGGTKVSDAIENKITRGIEKGFGKALARVGYKATGESLEEVSEVIGTAGLNWIINQVTEQVGHGAKFDSSVNVEELVENAVIGFFSGGFGEGSSTFAQNSALSNQEISRVENETGKKLTSEEKQKIKEQTLYNTQTQRENEIIVDNSKLSDKMKQNIKDISQKYNLSNADVESMIKRASETQNQGTTMENKSILENGQQTTLPKGKMAENQTSQQPLGNEKYSIKMPDSNYKFEKTGNQNEDILDESMSKYFNNSEDTKKLNKTLKQIMRDKNLSVRFDDTITDEAENILDGKYENGVITINPNSTKAFEYVATHELTHAIGTKEMLDMVQKYRESNKEFNTKLETILKNYNKSELTEEALADVSAELFGTQEFIANVKNTNPNLFQKIYNEIKYLWHQFRGYKNQNQFVEDLYNKWTQAYNSNAELNQTTRKMVVARETKYTKGTQEEAINRIKNGENPADVYEQTGWYIGIEGDKVKTLISDENADLTMDYKNAKKYYNQDVTLSDILKHDELYEIYPELKDVKIDVYRFEDTKGNDDYETAGEYLKTSDKINLNLNYIESLINKNADVKDKLTGVVLHEIQHWVQNKENFESGSNEYLFETLREKKSEIRNIVEKAGNAFEDYKKQISYNEVRNDIIEDLTKHEGYTKDRLNDKMNRYLEENGYLEKFNILKDKFEKYSDFEDKLNSKQFTEKDLYKITAGEEESEFTRENKDKTIDELKKKIPEYSDEYSVLANTAYELYNEIKGGGKNAKIHNVGPNSTSNSTYNGMGLSRQQAQDRYDNATIEQVDRNSARTTIEETAREGTDRTTINGNTKGIQNRTEGLEESSSFNLQKNKEKQLEIIQKSNPMHDDYHTGIRTIDDIKTYQEALNDDLDGEIQDLTPDFKADELRKALETGEITVYSSYPIEQGVFVTPSNYIISKYNREL